MNKATENQYIEIYQSGKSKLAKVALSKLFIAHESWLNTRIMLLSRYAQFEFKFDIRQEAYLAFIQAVKQFDLINKPSIKLKTLAGRYIDWQVNKLIKAQIYCGLKAPVINASLRKMILNVMKLSFSQAEQVAEFKKIAQAHNQSLKMVKYIAKFLSSYQHSSFDSGQFEQKEIDSLFQSGADDVFKQVAVAKIMNKAHTLLANAPNKTKTILNERWFRSEPVPYERLAKQSKVTPEAIRMREKRALQKLRIELEA